MESPGLMPNSPMDLMDDAAYPCKGCGEILEEGKAFELAGNRWHIDCFRCNTCGTLLDSDANLLLLGDGSLICNNCTYSCSACNQKIEDLAILTGEQAFCAGCFRCRNCKRKIENLRYARTSQGIFCMSCHESLMARRRKRSKNNAAKTANSNSSALDKALPAPPPVDDEATPVNEKPAPNALSPRPMQTPSKIPSGPPSANSITSTIANTGRTPTAASPNSSYSPSPIPDNTPRGSPHPSPSPASVPDNYLRAPTTKTSVKNKRQSMYSHISDDTSDVNSNYSEGSLFPILLDEGPSMGPSVPVPTTTYRNGNADNDRARMLEKQRELDRQKEEELKRAKAEELRQAEAKREQELREREKEKERLRERERSISSSERERERLGGESQRRDSRESDRRVRAVKDSTGSAQPSPTRSEHSATKEDRQASQRRVLEERRNQSKSDINFSSSGDDVRAQQPISGSGSSNGNFKLQEVPRTKKATPKLPPDEDSDIDDSSPVMEDIPISFSPDPVLEGPPPGSHPQRLQSLPTHDGNAAKTDSIGKAPVQGPPVVPYHKREELKSPAKPPEPFNRSHPTSRSSSAGTGTDIHTGSDLSSSSVSAQTSITAPPLGPGIPKEASSTTTSMSAETIRSPVSKHRPSTSQSTTHSLSPPSSDAAAPNGISPILPPYRPILDMSFEEEMGKIFGGGPVDNSASLLKRVSNAVKHGRSFSDIASRASQQQSPKWPRSPSVGSTTYVQPFDLISSPTASAVDAKEENAALKHALRKSTQQIAELESKLNHSEIDVKGLDENIQQKKTTVATLETQRETTMLELSVLNEKITDKDGKSFNVEEFKSEILKSLAKELEELKASFAPQIEALIVQRNSLLEETANLCRLRDQAIQETEQLNSKNLQLADLNNELTRRIQGTFVANKAAYAAHAAHQPNSPSVNGAAIYGQQPIGADTSSETLKEKSSIAASSQTNVSLSSATMASTPTSEPLVVDSEAATVMTAPHIVNIRKPGQQVRKFNWKKGGQAVGKGVGKAFNKVFALEAQQAHQEAYAGDQLLANSQPYGSTPYGQPPSTSDTKLSSEGYGTQQQSYGTARGGLLKKLKSNNTAAVQGDTVPLFGSELEARVEFEGRRIPLIVTKCLEEVETRGMDYEGIYRKGGGASQMRKIQDAFERGDDIALDDPSIDICAVTSVLKQYFRNLPTPLVTYQVYDLLIESSAIREPDDRKAAVRGSINELPSLNKDILAFMVHHLKKVAAMSSINLMNSRNLAVVFAPTLMRDLTGERELRDTHAKNDIIQYIIDHEKDVFADL